MSPPRLALAILACSASGQAVAQQTASVCVATRLSGAVDHGELFEATFASDLIVRLAPASHPNNPPGWTIQILAAPNYEHDYLVVATPPYRFANPRYLDTSYGRSAAQAVEWSVREFRFVTGEEDYRRMSTALGLLLWPGGHTEAEIEAAEATMATTPTEAGRLTILTARTTAPTTEHAGGVIEYLSFEIELCTGGVAR